MLDLLDPLLLFEEIGDALSRSDPPNVAQRGPGEHVSQAAFDAPHTGLDEHRKRDSKQSPIIFSVEHSNSEEGVVSGMRKRDSEDENEQDSGVPGTIDIMVITLSYNPPRDAHRTIPYVERDQ